MSEPLQTAFKTIIQNQSSNEDTSSLQTLTQEWWRKIVSAYSESQRHYHTVEHITCMWVSLQEMPIDQLSNRDAVVLAILFHDIVYDPTAASELNERQSMQLWQQFAQEASLGNDLTDTVSTMIEATIKHALPANYPQDLPTFLDLDLEVLGRTRELYNVYASQIRLEYGHYPHDAYCKGRATVLEHLRTGDVYFTDYWKQRLTAQAQANLNWEIGELANGSIPRQTSTVDN